MFGTGSTGRRALTGFSEGQAEPRFCKPEAGFVDISLEALAKLAAQPAYLERCRPGKIAFTLDYILGVIIESSRVK